MHTVIISKTDQFLIDEKSVHGSLKLEPGKLSLIYGENGVGKSTLLQYLKKQQKKYFPDLKTNFTDQLRMSPLNDVSFKEIEQSIKPYQNEELDLFSENYYLIEKYSNKTISELSGGQNQMVKILTSLFISGDIFFFDEPLQYLDKKNVTVFIEILKELKKRNKAICIVEHHLDIVIPIVDLFFGLESGQHEIELKETNGI